MNKILFFDAAASGHHGEFLENLIFGLPNEFAEDAMILTHPSLRERMEGCRDKFQSKVCLKFLTSEELNYLRAARGIVQIGRRQLKVLDKYRAEFNPKRVVLMHMNLHQYALHGWKLPSGVEVSGILLNPYTPMDRAYGLRAKTFSFFTGIRKRLQFKLMLRNQAINKISLLNDPRMAEQLNRWHPRRQVFDSVADPLSALWPSAPEAEIKNSSSDDVFTFLLAGSMAHRKGCIETLNALMQLKPEPGRFFKLRLVGRFREDEKDYKDQVLAKIKELESQCASIRVSVKDDFVSNEAMSREFAAADCVLAPYLDFHGSSGMIGHACRYFKPLLVCRDGLIGEIVRGQKLGICVDPRQAEAFAAAMHKMICGDYAYDPKLAVSYLSHADPVNFAKGLIA